MNVTGTEDLKYPEKEALDVIVDKTIELAANPISTVAQAMVGSLRETIEECRDEFFRKLAAKVNEHESRLSDLEVGAKHASATYGMCQAFLRTNDEDQKNTLVNAAANVLLNPPESELEENEFLEFLGLPSFNVYHVRLMRLFSWEDPEAGRSVVMGSLTSRIEQRRDEYGLGANDAILKRAWDDLKSRGLLDGDLNTHMSGSSIGAKRTTALGDRFLAFIDE